MDSKKKKILIITISVISVLAIIGIICIVIYFNTDKVTPEQTIETYMGYIKDENFDAMYDMISEDSKSKTSKDDFIKRNKNIYEGIEAKNLSVSSVQADKMKKSVSYQTVMDTMSGNVSFSNTAKVSRTSDKTYKIDWNSSLIFPQLTDTDKVRVSSSEGKRGSILDRNGKVLAGEGEVYSVGLVPGKMSQNKDGDIMVLSSLLGISTDFINSQLKQSYVKDDTFVPLKTISKDNEVLNNNLSKVNGVQFTKKKTRVYPYGESTSQLLGYVQSISADELKANTDKGYTSTSIIGKSGLEKNFEDKLRGTNGSEIYIADSKGNKKQSIIKQQEKNGNDVKLTIDIDTQNKLYDLFKQDKSASVAMNPKTGEVLALVSTPTFNSNDFVLGITNDKWNSLNSDVNRPLFNRYLASYAPGSSFKPVTGSIGLSTNSFSADDNFGTSGTRWQKDSSWKDFYVTTLDTYSGPANLKNGLVFSDNIYFAKAALKIGSDKFAEYAAKIGFGKQIDFAQSLTKSQVSSSGKISSEGQLANSGYGQGEVLVNPVHMASIYSAFVNDGSMIKPYLEYKDNPTKEFLIQNAFTKEAANTIKDDLVQVVENPGGTGHSARIDGLKLAGKTGTAEIKQSRDDTNGTELGWFDEFIADENSQKQLLVISMVEDVKGRGGSHYVVPKVAQLFR